MKFYTNVDKLGDQILLRYIENNESFKLKLNYNFELYIISNSECDSCSEFNDNLSRINFSTPKELSDFIETYKHVIGFRIFGMKDPIFQFINREFTEEIKYDSSLIKGAIFDIEIFSGDINNQGKVIPGPFPNADTALYPITAITIYNTYDKKYHVFTLNEFKGKKLNFEITNKFKNIEFEFFSKEENLLKSFSLYWSEQDFHFYSGFNVESFDTAYLINRIKNILDNNYIKLYSPWNYVKNKTIKNAWGESNSYTFLGCPCLDYLQLVQKHGHITLPNWKLDTVAEHYLKENKLEYEGSLNDLYINNFQKYIEYNIRDVELIVKLEDKCRFIETTFAAAYVTHSNYTDTLGTVRPWSSLAYNVLYKKNIQPELKPIFQGEIDFPGGFVLQPTPGKYNWVLSVDAKSLYPHMAMQFNVGNTSLADELTVGNIRKEIIIELQNELKQLEKYSSRYLYINKLLDHIIKNIPIHEIYWQDSYEFKALKKYKVCMSPNLTFFYNEPKSMFHEIYEDIYYNKRIKAQQLMNEKDIELNELKKNKSNDKELINKLTNEVAALNTLQTALKIAVMNAGYGAMSNRYFTEYFNINIAATITTGGQVGIRFISRKLNEYFNFILKTNNYNYVIANDTDSCYITLEPLIKQLLNDKSDIEIVNFLNKLFKTKIEHLITQWAEELSNNLNCKQNRLFFAREVIAKTGIFVAKKRYALSILDEKGKTYHSPKLKVIGLDSVRSTYPKHCRDWLEECYKICLDSNNEELIHNKIKELRNLYENKSIEDIAIASTVNGIEKYSGDDNLPIKGSPIYVKAAIYHNYLIKKNNLNLPLILSGDKILYIPLKKNPYNIDVIAFQNKFPSEFNLEKYIDRNITFEKTFISPLKLFLESIKWNTEPKSTMFDFL